MAQTGALQLRCCANKNSVTHNSFSLQIVKRSLFYSRKSSLATGTTRSTVSLGDFEPWKGTRERVKIKSFIIIRVRRQRRKKRLQMELFVTLCAPPCSSSVYWQPVITVLTTIGASKCSHLTVIVGNRLQVPSRFFSFFPHRGKPPFFSSPTYALCRVTRLCCQIVR